LSTHVDTIMRMDAIYNASYSTTKLLNVVYQRFIFLLIIAQLYLIINLKETSIS